jgi:hypothetical protein
VLRQHAAERATLPPGCDIRPDPLDNLEPDAPLSHWAQGFGMGHDYLVEYWDEFTPEELDEALGAALMTLTFFSSASLARAYHEEGRAGTSLAQLAGTVLEIFHDALGEYAHLGRAIYQGRCEAGDLSPAPATGRKVGRNDPCPCGSGSKYQEVLRGDLTRVPGPYPRARKHHRGLSWAGASSRRYPASVATGLDLPSLPHPSVGSTFIH